MKVLVVGGGQGTCNSLEIESKPRYQNCIVRRETAE